MRPTTRTLIMTSLVALGGLLSLGAGNAEAQLVVTTPGVSVGVGTPYVGAYPGYAPVAPVVPVAPVAPVYSAYPVRPLPYVYGRPRVYGPRPYYGYRGGYRGGYRRW